MKRTWMFYVNGKKHWFTCYKVYYAYRWYIAEQIDLRSSTTPVKTQWGSKIELTNYAKDYEPN
jgi:hypothetical protein